MYHTGFLNLDAPSTSVTLTMASVIGYAWMVLCVWGCLWWGGLPANVKLPKTVVSEWCVLKAVLHTSLQSDPWVSVRGRQWLACEESIRQTKGWRFRLFYEQIQTIHSQETLQNLACRSSSRSIVKRNIKASGKVGENSLILLTIFLPLHSFPVSKKRLYITTNDQ